MRRCAKGSFAMLVDTRRLTFFLAAKVTSMCIQCFDRLYAIHAASIGAFSDMMILIRSMATTRSIETQHRLLGFLGVLLGVRISKADDSGSVADNAEQLLNTESIGQLCQFVAWGHTNTSQTSSLMARALLQPGPTTSLLTDGPLLAREVVRKEPVWPLCK
jgi:hypothetical protein